MNGTENEPKQQSKYYPLGYALHSALVENGFSVSYLNGKATISYGTRSLTFIKRDGLWFNLNRKIYFNTRTAILFYAHTLMDFT